MKTNKRKWAWVGLAIIVVVFVGINAKSIWHSVGGGSSSVSLTVPLSGSTIFVDGKELQVTGSDNQSVALKGLSGGAAHTIIVSKDKFWPWTKSITADESKSLVVTAFNASGAMNGTAVSASDRAAATAALQKAILPTTTKPLVSKSGNVAISVESDSINATWQGSGAPKDFFCSETACDTTEVVFKGTAPVVGVSFYKDRDDVILLSSGGAIYAIELDRKGTQNFQPVYIGIKPAFAPADNNSIYVQDSGKLLKVTY